MDTIYPIANQMFTGYLMSTRGANDEIAGYFEALPDASLFGSPGGTGSVHRTIFGWYGTG